MPYEVTYDSKRNCIVTRIDGELDIPVIKESLSEIARMISTKGCQRILDDLRGAELMLSMGLRSDLPCIRVEEKYMSKSTDRAGGMRNSPSYHRARQKPWTASDRIPGKAAQSSS